MSMETSCSSRHELLLRPDVASEAFSNAAYSGSGPDHGRTVGQAMLIPQQAWNITALGPTKRIGAARPSDRLARCADRRPPERRVANAPS